MSNYVYREYEELSEIGFLSYYIRGLEGAFIAGGCFKNVFTKEKVKDIDSFFTSRKAFEEAVRKVEDWEDVVRVYANDNCIGYEDTKTGMKFELIRSIFGPMEHILDNFDFTVTQFAFSKTFLGMDDLDFPEYEYEVVHHEHFFQHIAQKRLVIDCKAEDIPFPFSTFDIMFRYAKYGYQPCRESKVKIINAMRHQKGFTEDDISKGLYDGGWD